MPALRPELWASAVANVCRNNSYTLTYHTRAEKWPYQCWFHPLADRFRAGSRLGSARLENATMRARVSSSNQACRFPASHFLCAELPHRRRVCDHNNPENGRVTTTIPSDAQFAPVRRRGFLFRCHNQNRLSRISVRINHRDTLRLRSGQGRAQRILKNRFASVSLCLCG